MRYYEAKVLEVTSYMAVYGAIGYIIEVLWDTGWGDEPIERMTHPAIFRDKARAEAFLAKIKKGHYEGIRLKNWILPTSESCAIRNKENPGHYSVI